MPKRLSDKEVHMELKKTPGWTYRDMQISRLYKFSEFVTAMAFVNHVADLAERMDHHPDIFVQYNKVTLTLSTHSAGGLTERDFALARQIDA